MRCIDSLAAAAWAACLDVKVVLSDGFEVAKAIASGLLPWLYGFSNPDYGRMAVFCCLDSATHKIKPGGTPVTRTEHDVRSIGVVYVVTEAVSSSEPLMTVHFDPIEQEVIVGAGNVVLRF